MLFLDKKVLHFFKEKDDTFRQKNVTLRKKILKKNSQKGVTFRKKRVTLYYVYFF